LDPEENSNYLNNNSSRQLKITNQNKMVNNKFKHNSTMSLDGGKNLCKSS